MEAAENFFALLYPEYLYTLFFIIYFLPMPLILPWRWRQQVSPNNVINQVTRGLFPRRQSVMTAELTLEFAC